MGVVNRMVLLLLMVLTACATTSQKNYKLAEESLKSGDYAQAFDMVVHSLNADIRNHKAIALFPAIAGSAYSEQFAVINQAKVVSDWDVAAYAYDRIINMNGNLMAVQARLNVETENVVVSQEKKAAINALLAMKTREVSGEREQAYEQAAGAHYTKGTSHAGNRQYRMAAAEFDSALSFIGDYRDAFRLAEKNRKLADLADARIQYAKAEHAVLNKQYRVASEAFAAAEQFVAGFRDAALLAAKFKGIADHEDALANYERGQQLADDQQYRAAAEAFGRTLSYVAGYRDAAVLADYYTDLANREDAIKFYRKGMRLMDRQDFEQAAIAFDRAEQFVAGFKDARAMAERARYFIPPRFFELRHLVQKSVKHGVPLNWLDDVHRGVTEHVKVSSIRVIREGRFNEFHEYWPYRIRVRGTLELELGKDNEEQRSFDTVVDYRVFRDDFGEWKATFDGSLY